jgi:SAM-dependent methyltransferase
MSPAEDAVTAPDPAQKVGQLVAQALAEGDATGWFERLYAAAEDGSAIVPWDRGRPHWLLTAWAQESGLDGDGRRAQESGLDGDGRRAQESGLRGDGGRALVVGCGLGADAEFIAGLGYGTLAFDISASAVRAARRRFPASTVDYLVADLLHPPPGWRHAFDLVVESQTIQALPDPPRRDAIARIGDMVAPGGTLVVIALARDASEDPGQWPPWPVTRAEVEAFAADGLAPVRIEDVPDSGQIPPGRRWLAEFRRPG